MKMILSNLILQKRRYDAAETPEHKCNIAMSFFDHDVEITINEISQLMEQLEKKD